MIAERLLLVDASVLITLAEIGETDLLFGPEGTIAVPEAVRAEVTDDPAATELAAAIERGDVALLDDGAVSGRDEAADRLGRSTDETEMVGDVALLARAHERERAVVVTDDRPLRTVCKSLSIPVSGAIGVLIRAVERGAVPPETAKERLVAMDRTGGRLSASLLRRAERLIDDAAES